MQARITTAVLLGFILVGAAACGGGGGDDEAQLRTDLEAAQQELEEQRKAAEEAEEARKKAEEEAAEAERKRLEEEAARGEAEDEAEQERLAAEEAEQERLAAEAEQQRLEQEAEEAEQRANAAEAARVHTGLSGTIAHTLAVSPRYGSAADITIPANITSSGAGSMGRWFKTSGSSQSQTAADRVEVYSDVEAPKSIPFKDSMYNEGDTVVDAQGMVLPAGYDLETDLRMDVASGSFDRTSAPAKSFDIIDRGEHTTAQQRTDAINTAQADFDGDSSDANRAALEAAKASKVRDTDRHPYRWSAEVGGTLGSASGTFRCGSDASDESTSCTVQNTGGGFVFSNLWTFVPSSGTVGVRVADAQYMWFGWWSREALPAGTFAFDTNHGGTGQLSGALTGVTGTATYNGIAVGRYAISGTLVANQGHGDFSADAQLVADFGANTVVGTLSGFTGQPDWEVTLGGGTISGAEVTGAADSVTWSIGGDARDGGQWEADFYSNLPADQREGVQPYGIAGTFEADHGDAARMIGAFGAHR